MTETIGRIVAAAVATIVILPILWWSARSLLGMMLNPGCGHCADKGGRCGT